MPKTKISEFSATPGNNTDIDGINIAEGCAPSGINDAIRELMAQLKDFQAGTAGDSFNGPVGTTTAAAGAFTTLSASGNITVSGGTANGVAYLNASKVLTTGSALSFDGTNFATTGSGTVKNLLLTAGTLPGAGNPSISLRSADNVIYHQSGSANTIVMLDSAQNTMQSIGATAQIWNISNAEAMRLTSTGLGIGTSSPGARLTTRAQSNTYTGGAFQIESASGTFKSYITNVGGLLLFSNSSTVDQLILDSSGNLGLGVTPSAWSLSGLSALQIKNGSIYGYLNEFGSQANSYYNAGWKYITSAAASQYVQTSGAHQWYTAPSGTAGNAISFTQSMTLDASGRLGIGRTSMTYPLDVQGADGNGIRFTDSTFNVQSFVGGYSSAGIFGTLSNHPTTFWTNNAERARITSGGYFKASNTGTYAGSTGGYHEFYQTNNSDTVRVTSTSSAVSGAYGVYVDLTTDPNATDSFFLRCFGGANQRASIRSNGGLANYQANDVNLSDQRLKTDVQEAGTYLDKICAIPVKTFLYKDQTDTERNLGVMAQDVDAVAPELIDHSGFGDAPEGESPYLAVYQTDLQYALMKCIQELKAELDTVKAELATLKGQP